MKGVIFGGAGFIGSNIVNTLRDIEWTVVDDFSLGKESNILNHKAEIITGNIADEEVVEQALYNHPDVVLMMNGPSSNPMYYPDPRRPVNTIIQGALNVFETCRKRNIDQIIYASTSSLYGNTISMTQEEHSSIIPPNFYSAPRRFIEDMARIYFEEYGINSVGWRYFSVYGKNETHKGKYANIITQFIWDMLEDKQPVIYGDGFQTRDFIHVSDIVKANELAIFSKFKGAKIYNVGTNESYSFNEVVDLINKHLEKDIEPKYVKNQIHNYVFDTKASTRLIEKDFGFEAKMSLNEGIKKTIDNYKTK